MMKSMYRDSLSVLVLAMLAAVTGCSSNYYKITDPTSGKVYYTEEIDSDRKADAVKFEDTLSKSRVTLQNSEVKEISSNEYQAAIAAQKKESQDKAEGKPAEGSQPQ